MIRAMRIALCALLSAAGAAGAPGSPRAAGAAPGASASACHDLELRVPSKTAEGTLRDVPLYLAFPESLGPVSVRAFLEAPPLKAAEMIKQSDWQIKALGIPERRVLKALRDLVDGRVREAGEGFASVSAQVPALQPVIRNNRTLILFLAGFPADAEKEWQSAAARPSGCDEAVRKNLFSIYLGRNDAAKAHALVDEVLERHPKSPWANAFKGYLLQMRASDEEWERFLREKSEAQDSLFEIQIAYGQFLKERRRYEEAVRYYTRGLEGAPRNGPAWLDLADAYQKLGLSFLAQAALEKCFEAGITDPYVYELLGRVLVELSSYAAPRKSKQDWMWGVLDMRDLQWGLDPSWADRCWRLAERNVELGLPKDLNNRSMAQLLYHLYCHNGRIEAARNLRENFWFLFSGPAISKKAMRLGPSRASESGLHIRLGATSAPLVFAALQSDFFEAF
jgi:tetratricopeptide (TPR) repeat protein